MIDQHTILAQLHTTLTGYAALTAIIPTHRIDLSNALNCDENIAGGGWIGVFPGKMNITPKTLGSSGNRWNATVELIVVVQWADVQGGEETTTQIDDATYQVLSAINSDPNLSNTWDMLTDIKVEPRLNTSESPYGEIPLSYQSRYITLMGESRL